MADGILFGLDNGYIGRIDKGEDREGGDKIYFLTETGKRKIDECLRLLEEK